MDASCNLLTITVVFLFPFCKAITIFHQFENTINGKSTAILKMKKQNNGNKKESKIMAIKKKVEIIAIKL